MIKLFTHKTYMAASPGGALLLFSIMMLNMGGNARAGNDSGDDEAGITSADALINALEAEDETTINVTESIELNLGDALQLGASKTLTISKGQTVTITGNGIDINGQTLTINGGGTLVCARESGNTLFGSTGSQLTLESITVDITSGSGINVPTLTVGSGGTIDIKSFNDTGISLSGTLTINSGGTVKVGAGSGRNEGIFVSNIRGQIILSGGTLIGSDGGAIYLLKESKVTGMSGKFNDQGNVLNKDEEVTVGEKNTTVSSDGLTEGYYAWNGILFAKNPKDGWTLTDGVLTISSDVGMQNWKWPKDSNSQFITNVTSATISEYVTKIVDFAFINCANLASVSIPSSVTSIGKHAFGSTKSLTAITIPSSVKEIGASAFHASALTSVTFERNTPPSIGADAFSGCDNLNDIFVPTNAIEAYKTALGKDWADKVESSDAPDNGWTISPDGTSLTITSDEGMLDWFPNGKLAQLETITTLTLGEKVTTIKDNYFSNCSLLATVTLNEGLTTIGINAFKDCPALTFLHLPASLTTLGNGDIKAAAFFGSSIAELTIEENNGHFKAVNGMLLDKDGTTLICCPPGKKDNFGIPDGVTTIGVSAFFGNKYLTAITLPANLTTLENAFNNCTFLKTVTFKGNLPATFNPSLFSGCTALTDIFVPADQVDAYQETLAGETGADKVKVYLEITSIQSDKLTSFTLKGKAETADIAIDSLNARYPGVSATLGNGKAIELPLTWTFKAPEQGPEEFSSASKAENTFTWTADKGSYTLSGELADTALTGEIIVTNPAVITDKEVITLSPNETLIGDGSTTAASVTPTGNATFENVKTEQTIVAGGTISSITLSGTVNLLGAIENEGTLILTAEPGTGIGVGTVTNNGIFIDNTGGVKRVTGPTSIDLTNAEPANESGTGQVTITTNPANIPSGASVTYTWQEWQDNRGWTDISTPHLRSTATGSNVLRTDITGTYRCRITVTAASGNVSTTLLTAPAVATVLPTPPPPPEPVYYNVTLPSVEGVVTDPAAGEHTVEEWTDFRFTLRLDEAYNQSVPVVTTDRGDELTPRPSDGAYIVSVRNDNVVITISGIVKNPDPVANAVIRSGSTIVSRGGLLIITTDRPMQAQVITFGGQVARSLSLPAGKTRIDALAAGSYIVRLSDGTVQKVIVQK